MERYAPTIKDLAPRDVVSRSIYQEIKEGRGLGPEGRLRPTSTSRTWTRGSSRRSSRTSPSSPASTSRSSPRREPVPIQPTAHYAMGGIPTDVHARVVTGSDETPVPGLYAAGECACVSVHGANRLGTNSLLDIVVFGRRGGDDMARHCAETDLARPARGRHRADTLDMLDGILTPDRQATTSPTSGRSCRTRCSTSRSWSGPRRACAKMGEILGAPPGAVRPDRDRRQGQRLQHRPDGGRRGRVPAGLRRDARRGRGRPATRAAAPTTGRTIRCATTRTGCKHSLAYRNDDGSIRLDTKPVKMGPYIPMERKY